MAGNYPDPFGPRLAYDRDGTIALIVNDNGTVTQLSGAQAGILAVYNNDSSDYGAYQAGFGSYGLEIFGTQYFCLVFPTPRTLTGWRFGWVGRGFHGAQWSNDTTNGFDGTWTATTDPGLGGGAQSRAELRSGITSLSGLNGIKAIRFRGDGPVYGTTMGALHLYGYPTTDGDRLLFWHPTLNQPLRATPEYLDFGNRPRDTTLSKFLRVKNVSSALTASNVVVSMEMVAPDASPSLIPQHTFSLAGGAFASSVSITSLAPGEISPQIEVKQALTPDAQMGLWSERFLAVAGGWA